jgi:hypothetical protein
VSGGPTARGGGLPFVELHRAHLCGWSTRTWYSAAWPVKTAGVQAGLHTLDSHYVTSGENAPIVCLVSGSPYLVEIDELP